MRAEIEQTIKRVTQSLAVEDLGWALTGSAGHALQGADLEPLDLDIQTDEWGAYRIADLLSKYCTRPVEWRTADLIRSHLGLLTVDGVAVEVMGAVQTRSSSGSWSAPVDVWENRKFVEFRGLSVPVMALEHEVGAYERLGRWDRVAVLRSLLQARRGLDN